MLLASVDVPRQAEPFGVAGNCQDAAGCCSTAGSSLVSEGSVYGHSGEKGKAVPTFQRAGIFIYLFMIAAISFKALM